MQFPESVCWRCGPTDGENGASGMRRWNLEAVSWSRWGLLFCLGQGWLWAASVLRSAAIFGQQLRRAGAPSCHPSHPCRAGFGGTLPGSVFLLLSCEEFIRRVSSEDCASDPQAAGLIFSLSMKIEMSPQKISDGITRPRWAPGIDSSEEVTRGRDNR